MTLTSSKKIKKGKKFHHQKDSKYFETPRHFYFGKNLEVHPDNNDNNRKVGGRGRSHQPSLTCRNGATSKWCYVGMVTIVGLSEW